MESYSQQNADERASRMTRRRNDLCAQRCQLEYKLKAISNQLEEAMRRLRDLECAASAPLRSPGSAWNINTHATFLQNLRQTRSTIEHTCNRLNMEKRRLQEDINRLDREMESIRC